jgi:hypothetical protein
VGDVADEVLFGGQLALWGEKKKKRKRRKRNHK